MWRWYTARERRNAALIITMLVLIALVVVFAASITATGLIGDLEPHQWVRAGLNLLTGTPLSQVLPGIPTPVWATLTILTAAAAAAGCVVAARPLWWTLAPAGDGFASRVNVAKELSLAAARQKAAVTRPDLTKRQRRRAPLGEVAVPLGHTMWHQPLCVPLENGVGVLAPQQSGKSLMVLIHMILSAPGATIITSTKLDLFLNTALARSRCGGPVAVFDLAGNTPWPFKVRWNVIDGCTDFTTAHQRAAALMVADHKPGQSEGGNHGWFRDKATDLLACLLLAAALDKTPLARFVAWCQNDRDTEAATILRTYPQFVPQARIIEADQALAPETRGSIWASLGRGVAALTDTQIVDSCIPKQGETPFDVASWLKAKGTIYVIGSERDAASHSALVTAFVEHVLNEGRRQALETGRTSGYERLAPPLVAILDELTNICPLPTLPATISDSAGRGLVIVWASQSLDQLIERWGENSANILAENSTAILAFGGVKGDRTLRWLSTILGDRDEERISFQSRGLFGSNISGSGRQIGLERRRILPEATIRMIPRQHALLVYRHLPPLIARLQPAWKLPNWKDLTNDATAIRSNNLPELATTQACVR